MSGKKNTTPEEQEQELGGRDPNLQLIYCQINLFSSRSSFLILHLSRPFGVTVQFLQVLQDSFLSLVNKITQIH